jgi:hypothetical protein
VLKLESNAEQLAHALQHGKRGFHDFGANAVPGKHGHTGDVRDFSSVGLDYRKGGGSAHGRKRTSSVRRSVEMKERV